MNKKQSKKLETTFKAIWIITWGIYLFFTLININPELLKISQYIALVGMVFGGFGLYFQSKSK